MILWVPNLGQGSPGKFSLPMSYRLQLLGGVQLMAPLVWKVQDGLNHMDGTLVVMAGRPSNLSPSFSTESFQQHSQTSYMVAQDPPKNKLEDADFLED